MPADSEVLIAGAGPTGLVLALWLSKLGVRVRVIDKNSAALTTSRAIGVQSRTLEFYRQLGFAHDVVERGRPIGAVNVWSAGRHAARAAFGDLGTSISPYPYVLVFSQDEHERLLGDRLRDSGVHVERGSELLSCEANSDGVRVRLRRSDGRDETATAAYVAGCDGAHSAVRDAMSIGFPGGLYEHLFYVADVEARGAVMNGEIHVALDRSDFLAVFPMKADGRGRLVGTVRSDIQRNAASDLSWKDVSQHVIEWLPIAIDRVNWFSTYRVHHRVADRFRTGRVFLLGDAAHIHSPVGGQGMNTGIGDAVNLGWKLAAVLHSEAAATILDSYEEERIAFARRLVATTDRVFTAVTSSTAFARAVRLRLLPVVLPALTSFAAIRRFMFRTVSQTMLNYRGSGLSEGGAGGVEGGDRLPWVRADSSDSDNFAPLRSLRWQLHVYGDVSREIQSACDQRGLPVHVFPWREAVAPTGLSRNAFYLIRPDGYVALAGTSQSIDQLRSYLDSRCLKTGRD